MRKTFLLAITALVALMAASCQKEELGRVLTATIEQYEHDSNAKVYVNPQHYACWNDGDTVRINGQEVLVSIDEESATLPIPQGMENQDITAYYPASDINSNMSGVTLPYEQLYRTDDQGRQIIHNPMAAYCPAGGTKLKFRNLAALLKITLPAQEDGAVVHSITVKGSKDYPLCGTATLQFASDHKPQLSTPLQEGCDSVTLTHIDVALTTNCSFYIVVPAYSLFREITVSVVLERPQEVIRRNRKTDDTFGHLLDRNHIGALTYNLDGTGGIIGGKRVILYTTSDGSILTPQNMENCDNSEYGALVFGYNVTSIGNNAFDGCSNLTSITLPEGVTTIGDHAFCGCSNLTSITLPEGVTTIGDNAFYGCRNLTRITLSEDLITIGDFAFEGCWSLGSITLPEGVTTIGNNAFYGCRNLTSITLPEGVTTIGIYAFNGCSKLNSITFPTSLTIIGDGAFQRCGFSNITWPAGVTSIGYGVFVDCDNLTSITLPEGVTTIGFFAFSRCKNLTGITLPEGVTTIGDGAFSECSNLSGITLPEGVTTIGGFAFSLCSNLASISLPQSLTEIGEFAFNACSNLARIDCYATTPPNLGDNAFDGIPSTAELHVPHNKAETYSGSNWGTVFYGERRIIGNL